MVENHGESIQSFTKLIDPWTLAVHRSRGRVLLFHGHKIPHFGPLALGPQVQVPIICLETQTEWVLGGGYSLRKRLARFCLCHVHWRGMYLYVCAFVRVLPDSLVG